MASPGRRPDAYLVEVAAGVALLLAVNLVLFPGDPGLLGLHPHPTVFLAAIMAVRYGLREGVLTAAVGTGFVLAWTFLRAEPFTLGLLRQPATWTTPLLLGATGFVLGALGEWRRREVAELRAAIASLEAELADQAVRFMASAEAKHELERRVAEERGSLTKLYAAARAMDALEPDRLYPAVAATTREFLQADACQLYLAEGGTLRLRAAEGPPPRPELAPDEGLVGLAIRRGRPASVRDLTRIATLDDLRGAAILMAAPVLDGTGGVLGCITVTQLPFLKVTPASLDRLGVVAEWAGRAIGNARRHERVLASTVTEDLFRSYTYAYFQRRLDEERARAARYGRPLSVVVFRIHGLDMVRLERRPELGRVLGLVFSRIARNTDLVCRYATDDSFAIILPETPAADAERFIARLDGEIRNFRLLPYADEDRELEFSVRLLEPVEPGVAAR